MSEQPTKPESSPTNSSPTPKESPTNKETSQTNKEDPLKEVLELLKEQVPLEIQKTLELEGKSVHDQIQTLKIAKKIAKSLPTPTSEKPKPTPGPTNTINTSQAESHPEPKKMYEINEYATYIAKIQAEAREYNKKMGGF